MTRARRRASACRSVGYGWTTALRFPEEPVESLLRAARLAGLVAEYDTGRGATLWLDGRPGRELRALRREVVRLLSPYSPTAFQR